MLCEGSQFERFQEGDVPPDLPKDCFFKLEITTQYVTSVAPFEIGNAMLFFLEAADAIITKVRRPKFAITADVFIDSLRCTTKVRVYSLAGCRFAIEFQRRSGDSLSFNAVYERASRYLPRLDMEAAVDEPLFNFQPLPAAPDHAVGVAISAAGILPLLDMTSLVGAPWLQAEAAAALCEMADNPILWTTRVFQGIEKLLQATSTEVDYPTACLLERLSQQAGAVPCFASEGFMPAVMNKVAALQTHPKVRAKLARALSSVIRKQSLLCVSTRADGEAAASLRALDEALGQNVAG